MGSMRLPGKVLAPIDGRPMLEQLLLRLRTARTVATVIVATGSAPQNDPIDALATRMGVPVFRGSESDVLDRFVQASRQWQAETVVRLTGDNPLVDGAFVDMVVRRYQQADPPVVYADTATSASWPYGLSVEVFSREALEAAWQSSTDPADREHVTKWIRDRPDRFAALHLRSDSDDGDLRWTVDTADDLAHVRRLFTELGLSESAVGYDEIVGHERAMGRRS
jgi:spore coat polysaccharide biosynthesis protein SpsF (cytidylyltransferase family)